MSVNGQALNRAQRRRAARQRSDVAPEVIGPTLPPEIVEALTAKADPFSLYGQAMARVVQLENVVNVMITYLTRLAEEAKAPDKDQVAAVVGHATKKVAEAKARSEKVEAPAET